MSQITILENLINIFINVKLEYNKDNYLIKRL